MDASSAVADIYEIVSRFQIAYEERLHTYDHMCNDDAEAGADLNELLFFRKRAFELERELQQQIDDKQCFLSRQEIDQQAANVADEAANAVCSPYDHNKLEYKIAYLGDESCSEQEWSSPYEELRYKYRKSVYEVELAKRQLSTANENLDNYKQRIRQLEDKLLSLEISCSDLTRRFNDLRTLTSQQNDNAGQFLDSIKIELHRLQSPASTDKNHNILCSHNDVDNGDSLKPGSKQFHSCSNRLAKLDMKLASCQSELSFKEAEVARLQDQIDASEFQHAVELNRSKSLFECQLASSKAELAQLKYQCNLRSQKLFAFIKGRLDVIMMDASVKDSQSDPSSLTNWIVQKLLSDLREEYSTASIEHQSEIGLCVNHSHQLTPDLINSIPKEAPACTESSSESQYSTPIESPSELCNACQVEVLNFRAGGQTERSVKKDEVGYGKAAFNRNGIETDQLHLLLQEMISSVVSCKQELQSVCACTPSPSFMGGNEESPVKEADDDGENKLPKLKLLVERVVRSLKLEIGSICAYVEKISSDSAFSSPCSSPRKPGSPLLTDGKRERNYDLLEKCDLIRLLENEMQSKSLVVQENSRLVKYEKAYNSVKNSLARCGVREQRYNDKIADLRLRLQSCTSESDKSDTEKEEIAEDPGSVRGILGENHRLIAQNHDVREAFAAQTQRWQREVDSLTCEIESLKDEIEAKESAWVNERDDYEAQIRKLQQNLSTAKGCIDEMLSQHEQQMIEMSEELERWKEIAAGRIAACMDDSGDGDSSSRSVLNCKEPGWMELQECLKSGRDREEKLMTQLQTSEEATRELQEKAERAVQDSNFWQENLKETEGRLEVAHEQALTVQCNLEAEHAHKIERLDCDLKHARNQVSTCQEQIKALSEDKAILSLELQKNLEERSELKISLVKLRQESASSTTLMCRLKEAEKSLERTQTQLNEKLNDMEHLKSEFETVRGQLFDKCKECDMLNETIAFNSSASKAEEAKLKRNIQGVLEQNERLKVDAGCAKLLQGREEKIFALQAELSRVNQELCAANLKASEVIAARVSLEQLECLEADSVNKAELLEKYKEHLAIVEEERNKMASQLGVANEKKHNLELEVEKCQREIASQAADINKIQADFDDWKMNAIAQYEDTVRSYEEKVSALYEVARRNHSGGLSGSRELTAVRKWDPVGFEALPAQVQKLLLHLQDADESLIPALSDTIAHDTEHAWRELLKHNVVQSLAPELQRALRDLSQANKSLLNALDVTMNGGGRRKSSSVMPPTSPCKTRGCGTQTDDISGSYEALMKAYKAKVADIIEMADQLRFEKEMVHELNLVDTKNQSTIKSMKRMMASMEREKQELELKLLRSTQKLEQQTKNFCAESNKIDSMVAQATQTIQALRETNTDLSKELENSRKESTELHKVMEGLRRHQADLGAEKELSEHDLRLRLRELTAMNKALQVQLKLAHSEKNYEL